MKEVHSDDSSDYYYGRVKVRRLLEQFGIKIDRYRIRVYPPQLAEAIEKVFEAKEDQAYLYREFLLAKTIYGNIIVEMLDKGKWIPAPRV